MGQNRDLELIEMLGNNPEKAIEHIFNTYYEFVFTRVYRVLYDKQATEDVVQEIFLVLWQKRTTLTIESSLKAYLGRMGLNRALNYIRDNKKFAYADESELKDMDTRSSGALAQLSARELHNVIHVTIESLPPRCRLVFSLSRFEDMTYKEIADHLQISVKTVENQMLKALKILRKAVHQYNKEIHRGGPPDQVSQE